jgi:hypothetical protein
VGGEGVGAGGRAAAQPQGRREDGGAVGDRRGVEGDDRLGLFVLLSSPTRRALVVLLVESIEPPALEVSLDSSTQPSWAATEVKVTWSRWS